MTKNTPQNVAALAMTLSHAIHLKEHQTKAMKGVYSMLKHVFDALPETPDAPPHDDLENETLKFFVAQCLAEMARNEVSLQATPDHCSNMYLYMCDAVDNLKQHPDMAHKMAKIVLGDMYPKEKNEPQV
jgi:hypothetical protein